MTNRELLVKAMPLKSLSKKEWDALAEFIEGLERTGKISSAIHSALETLRKNQARIEVMCNYIDCYADLLDEPVREESVPIEL